MKNLFAFSIGDAISAPAKSARANEWAQVSDKAALPAGFSEAHMVRISFSDGSTEVFDCSEGDVMAAPWVDAA